MGIQPYDPDMSRSEDDIRRMVSDSEKGGEIDPVESRLIDNVFDFADRVARAVPFLFISMSATMKRII